MKLKSASVHQFTVFENADLDFCEGINVFIGANGTGKSHILKLLYSVPRAPVDARLSKRPNNSHLMRDILHEVFKLDSPNCENLVRQGREWNQAIVNLETSCGSYEMGFDVLGVSSLPPSSLEDSGNCIFIPPSDIMASMEGFAQLYEQREVSFDGTYYDLCRAMGLPRLKNLSEPLRSVIDKMETLMGGKLVLSGNRFHMESADGKVESHLMAEGHRKLGTLLHLIANGTLQSNAILFWDEPEANLNPRLITLVAEILRVLASQGVQIFLATHDYLLTGELSLAAEYKTEPQVSIRFFAFHKETQQDPVSVESGATLADLAENPILEEFAAHYDREQANSFRSLKVSEDTPS